MKLTLFAVSLATFQYVQCSPIPDLTYTNIVIAFYQQCYKPKPFNSMAIYLATKDPEPTWAFIQDEYALDEYVSQHYSQYGLDNGDPKCIQDFYNRYKDKLSVNAFEDVLLENPEVKAILHCCGDIAANFFANQLLGKPSDLVRCVKKALGDRDE
nr:unnamed protein product [Callosobruchus chinensis]